MKKKDSGNIYAMKALKKKELIQKRQLIYAVTEANVLKKAQYEFIVRLHYAFQVIKTIKMLLLRKTFKNSSRLQTISIS